MTDQELIQLFANALVIDPDLIRPERPIAEYRKWDSLGWLIVNSLLDERLGFQLTAKEIRCCVTVQDAVDRVKAKASAE